MNIGFIFSVLPKLIPLVLSLISLSEKLFAKPGSGAEKKKYVVEFLHGAVDNMVSVSTGGQKETWVMLEPILDKLIDFCAAFLFPKE